jgi:hypothetical protein
LKGSSKKRNKILVSFLFSLKKEEIFIFFDFCHKLLVIHNFSIFIFFVLFLLKRKHHKKQKVKNLKMFFVFAFFLNSKKVLKNRVFLESNFS